MAIKFGLKQLSKPAPIFYKRFVNALILYVIPSTATLITNLPVESMTDSTKVLIGLAAVWIISILKGLEYLLGTDSEEHTNESGK